VSENDHEQAAEAPNPESASKDQGAQKHVSRNPTVFPPLVVVVGVLDGVVELAVPFARSERGVIGLSVAVLAILVLLDVGYAGSHIHRVMRGALDDRPPG